MSKRAVILALYQILAGLVGVACFLIPMARTISAGNIAGIVIGSIALAFSALSVIAGFLIWRGKRAGIGLSALVQVLQLPILFIGGLRYQLALLASLTIGLSTDKQVLLKYGFGANITFLLGDLPFQFIGFNLLPLIVLLLVPGSLKKS